VPSKVEQERDDARLAASTLRDELRRVIEERDKWRTAMEDLTSGGSEYHDNLDRCVSVVRERINRRSGIIKKSIVKRKQTERALARACALVADCLGSCPFDHLDEVPWGTEECAESCQFDHTVQQIATCWRRYFLAVEANEEDQ